MGSFGEKLRREREMRKVSLDEIATVTKIGTRSLKALEDENFAILPGGIFNKGFVRAYARFLGMDEDQAVADYQAAANEQPVSVKQIATQSAIAKANRLAAQQARESSENSGIIRTAVLLIVVGLIAFGGYKAVRRGWFHALKRPSLHRQMKEPAPAVASTTASPTPVQSANTPADNAPAPATTAAPAPVATATPAARAPVPQPSPVAAEFTVGIKTSAESWLSVTADGKRAFQRLFEANEEQSVTATSKVQIKIGNPSGTELSLNGKPLAIGGDLSRPRTITVDASGLISE